MNAAAQIPMLYFTAKTGVCKGFSSSSFFENGLNGRAFVKKRLSAPLHR